MNTAPEKASQPKGQTKSLKTDKTGKSSQNEGKSTKTANKKDSTKFDEVLNKAQTENETPEPVGTGEAEVPTTPLAAEQLAAAMLVLQAEAPDIENLPGVVTPASPTVMPDTAAAQNAAETQQAASLAQLVSQPAETQPSPLSLDTLLQANKSGDKDQQILALLNGKAMGTTVQTNDSQLQVVPVEVSEMDTSQMAQTASAALQPIELLATAQQTATASLSTAIPPLPQAAGLVMNGQPAPMPVAKNELPKQATAEKTAKASLAETSPQTAAPASNLLADLSIKVEAPKATTPLTQQLQAMQQATRVKQASPVSAPADEVQTKTDTTTNNAAPSVPFAFSLTQATASQPTAAAADAKPVNTAYDIPKQIVEQARLIKTAENSQMVIKLSPEHLGEMVLKVSVSSNGSVNASFHSDNVEVRTIIENSIVQLRQELQAQGLKVDNVGVYAGLGNSLSNGQSGQTGQQQAGSSRTRKINLADFEEEASTLTAATAISSDDGIDYRV